eukprot:gnl/Spiro4/12651_TR6693_c0_g1_i1.p1 gnl/Spiro4/12651_TR6693_c0_g1~~gnl/Spiro4/12651_TR6693_c0_g1_i1.p1  ORF type:complete len:265 (-),score=33.52 gnl/Spiro4/12651_TR6693_c0_g1_i1:302-1063(-)
MEAGGSEPRKEQTPSRVLHVRNVGPDLTEEDLRVWASPFGAINNMVMLRAKNQALCEMKEMSDAMNLVQYYSVNPARVKGFTLRPQYSAHQCLTGGNQNTAEKPSRIILCSFRNVITPVTVDCVHRLCAPYGLIHKIVIFSKAAGVQALIQFAEEAGAREAKARLHNQIWNTEGMLVEVQYSNLAELTVNQNSLIAWDISKSTSPSFPGFAGGLGLGLGPYGTAASAMLNPFWCNPLSLRRCRRNTNSLWLRQ